jgi:hypothetical protein
MSRKKIRSAITRVRNGARPPRAGAPKAWFVEDPRTSGLVGAKHVWALHRAVACPDIHTVDAVRGLKAQGFKVVRTA